jgi:hypothetical protein
MSGTEAPPLKGKSPLRRDQRRKAVLSFLLVDEIVPP